VKKIAVSEFPVASLERELLINFDAPGVILPQRDNCVLLDFDIEADANREPLAARLGEVCTEFLYDNLLPRNIAARNSDQVGHKTPGLDRYFTDEKSFYIRLQLFKVVLL
jgi:hypothetical protein